MIRMARISYIKNKPEFITSFMRKHYPHIKKYDVYSYKGSKSNRRGRVYGIEMYNDGRFFDNSVQMYRKDYEYYNAKMASFR